MEKLAGGYHSPFTVRAGQYKRKLVPAEARQRVSLAYNSAQTRSNPLQNTVARVVAKRIIDCLEAIEIHHQQCDRFARPAGAEYGLFKAVLKQVAVRQIRNSIMVGEIDDAFLGSPASPAA